MSFSTLSWSFLERRFSPKKIFFTLKQIEKPEKQVSWKISFIDEESRGGKIAVWWWASVFVKIPFHIYCKASSSCSYDDFLVILKAQLKHQMPSLLRNLCENILRASHHVGHLFKFSPVILFSMQVRERDCAKTSGAEKSGVVGEKWNAFYFLPVREFPRNDRRTIRLVPTFDMNPRVLFTDREEVVAGCRGIYWPRCIKTTTSISVTLDTF